VYEFKETGKIEVQKDAATQPFSKLL
jgi:hypothetical protein